MDEEGYVHLPREPGLGYRIEWDYIMENQVSDVERALGTSEDFTLEQAIQKKVVLFHEVIERLYSMMNQWVTLSCHQSLRFVGLRHV